MWHATRISVTAHCAHADKRPTLNSYRIYTVEALNAIVIFILSVLGDSQGNVASGSCIVA